jgi:PASTA domain
MFGVIPVAALPAAEALVASSPTTEALAAGTLAANVLVAEKLAHEKVQAGPTSGTTSAGATSAAITLNKKRVPIGIGVAVLAAAVVALVLGNPFGAGGVGGADVGTRSPGGFTTAGGPASASPNPASSIDPTPTATDDSVRPGGGAAPTARPIATPTARSDATATPRPPGPTPTPRITAEPTPRPTPRPTPAATPTPEPAACLTVPNLVGMTVAKARGAWRGAGFTGGFTAPSGAGKQTVVTQSQPAGACLPPDTSITVTV